MLSLYSINLVGDAIVLFLGLIVWAALGGFRTASARTWFYGLLVLKGMWSLPIAISALYQFDFSIGLYHSLWVAAGIAGIVGLRIEYVKTLNDADATTPEYNPARPARTNRVYNITSLPEGS